jgi:hypothetical protein
MRNQTPEEEQYVRELNEALRNQEGYKEGMQFMQMDDHGFALRYPSLQQLPLEHNDFSNDPFARAIASVKRKCELHNGP